MLSLKVHRGFRVLVSLITFLIALQLYSRFLVVSAVASPKASLAVRVRMLVHSDYQIAAPHRSFLGEARLSLIPSANAQVPCESGSYCNSSGTMASCNDACPSSMCGKCPDCFSGTCTEYKCKTTTPWNKYCTLGYQSGSNCPGCRLDSATSNCTP